MVLLHVRRHCPIQSSTHRNELLCINQWDGIEDVSMACPGNPEEECPVSGDTILSNLNFEKVIENR